MGGLRTYQEDLKKLIFPGDKEPGRSALWGKQIPARISVYRNNTRSNWSDTLDCDFALTRAQFEEAEWRALSRRYFAKHPPQHWELNTSMQPFAIFLAREKVKPWIKELADYEWNDLKIFTDRSTVKTGSGGVNPTATVRVYQHQIFDWVELKAPNDRPPRQKPEVLVFYRDSRNSCHIREADPLMLLILDHFKTPAAHLADLEPIRAKLLPANSIPLESAVTQLKEAELLL